MRHFISEQIDGKPVGKLLHMGLNMANEKGGMLIFLSLSYMYALNMISQECYSRIVFVIYPLVEHQKQKRLYYNCLKLWKEDGFKDWVIGQLIKDYEERGIIFKDNKSFWGYLDSLSYLTTQKINNIILSISIVAERINENLFIKFYGDTLFFLKPTVNAYDLYKMENDGTQNIIAQGISNVYFDIDKLKINIHYGDEIDECYGVYDIEKGNLDYELKGYPYCIQESVWNKLSYEMVTELDLHWYCFYIKQDGKTKLIEGEPELAARRRLQIMKYLTEPTLITINELIRKIKQVELIDRNKKEATLLLMEFLEIVKIIGYKNDEDLSELFNYLYKFRDILFEKYHDVSILSPQFMKGFLPNIKNSLDIKDKIRQEEFPKFDSNTSDEVSEEDFMAIRYVGRFDYQEPEFLYERYPLKKGIVDHEYTIAPANKDNYKGGEVKYDRNKRLFCTECEHITKELLIKVVDVFGLQCEDDIIIKDNTGERVISIEDFLIEKNNMPDELPFN